MEQNIALTPEEMLQVYNQLLLTADAQDDRREHPRKSPHGRLAASVEVMPGQAPLGVLVRDMSCTGIGLLAPQPLTNERQIFVNLKTTGDTVLRVRCQVVSCRPDPEGQYIVGLSIVAIRRRLLPAAKLAG